MNNTIPTTLPTITRSDDIITLDDYVLNEGLPCNSDIIPQYLENDVIDLVSNLTTSENFSNEYAHYVNPSIPSFSNYEIPQITFNDNAFNNISNNLIDDISHEIFPRNNFNYETLTPISNERATTDHINLVNCVDGEMNNFNDRNSSADSNYVVVTSQEIIHPTDDILDLTNDEVDQIIDNNLPSQCFTEPFILPRTEDMESSKDESMKKSTMDIVEVLQNDFKESEIPEATVEMKKRCGRPKGARRTSE